MRVVGETGVGAPVYIDLRDINHRSLEIESTGSSSEVYSGIVIGTLLSIFCVFGFAALIMFQRKRFKSRQQGPTHLSTPTDIHFGNLTNTPGLSGGSAGGLSSATLPPDCHEMQNLIPKSVRYLNIIGRGGGGVSSGGSEETSTTDYQTTQLPNGNGQIITKANNENEISTTVLSEFETASDHNLSSVPLCRPSPQKKSKIMLIGSGGGGAANVSAGVSSNLGACHSDMSKPFFIPFKSHCVSIPHHTNSSFLMNKSTVSSSTNSCGQQPPSVLALATPAAAIDFLNSASSSRRSSSLSNNGNGNNGVGSNAPANSNNCSKMQKLYHTPNYPKQSISIDGICLLADEETNVTPTSEKDINVATEMLGDLQNGITLNGEVRKRTDFNF